MNPLTDGSSDRRPQIDALGTPRNSEAWVALAKVAYAAAWPRLRDPDDCREAAQEAMAALWRTPCDPDSLEAWVARVANNKACDILRERTRTRQAQEQAAADHSRVETSPVDEVGYEIDATELLELLTDREREATTLHLMQGRSRKETAKQMGVTDETVKTLLARARRRMRGAITRGGQP